MREQAYRLARAVDIFVETICKSKYSAKVYSIVSLYRTLIGLPLPYVQQLQAQFTYHS